MSARTLNFRRRRSTLAPPRHLQIKLFNSFTCTQEYVCTYKNLFYFFLQETVSDLWSAVKMRRMHLNPAETKCQYKQRLYDAIYFITLLKDRKQKNGKKNSPNKSTAKSMQILMIMRRVSSMLLLLLFRLLSLPLPLLPQTVVSPPRLLSGVCSLGTVSLII